MAARFGVRASVVTLLAACVFLALVAAPAAAQTAAPELTKILVPRQTPSPTTAALEACLRTSPEATCLQQLGAATASVRACLAPHTEERAASLNLVACLNAALAALPKATVTPTATPTSAPTATQTPTSTPTPAPTASQIATSTPTPIPTPAPTNSTAGTAAGASTATPTPTATPRPTSTPPSTAPSGDRFTFIAPVVAVIAAIIFLLVRFFKDKGDPKIPNQHEPQTTSLALLEPREGTIATAGRPVVFHATTVPPDRAAAVRWSVTNRADAQGTGATFTHTWAETGAEQVVAQLDDAGLRVDAVIFVFKTPHGGATLGELLRSTPPARAGITFARFGRSAGTGGAS